MQRAHAHLLVMNAGSSSIRFAAYQPGDPPVRRLTGKIDRVGAHGTTLTFDDTDRNERDSRGTGDLDRRTAPPFLLDWLEERIALSSLAAIGHRIVHGGASYSEPQRITPALLNELRRISVYAPEHLPFEIALIDLLRERAPGLVQFACFDTAFHRDMPRVARIVPIPRRFYAGGIERFGFHGLSYAFLMDELQRVAGTTAAEGRVILAHLGNGSSLAAVRSGKSIDTSMGLTPAGGVPMGTRSGDLDPGLTCSLAHREQMTAEQFHHMVNHESGLLGVSETSADVRDLLERAVNDVRAAEALALFCYQVKKCIGAYAAALGGLETLVFTGGIGENAPTIRARVCEDLDFLGIQLDAASNESGTPVISAAGSRVEVRVIRTDEEVMIAKAGFALIGAAA
ncbi:MAG: acetate/propionate family kinase [Gemmatimonadales bacterium]